MLPFANTRAIASRRDQLTLRPMDRAGWHSTDKLAVASPELNPVELLAVNRAILLNQNAVDDIRERRQLRALRRLASPISRRFRMQQYLGNRLAVDPELARSFPSAQTLTMTRQSHSSIKIHSVHPPPSIRSILTKAIDGPILVRRRNRTNRPLHWGIIAPPFSDCLYRVIRVERGVKITAAAWRQDSTSPLSVWINSGECIRSHLTTPHVYGLGLRQREIQA